MSSELELPTDVLLLYIHLIIVHLLSSYILHRKPVLKFNKIEQLTFNSPVLDKTCPLIFKRMDKSSIVRDSQPRSIAVGDFNNDHQVDVAVANSATNTILVKLLYDNGSRGRIGEYSTG